MASEAAFSALDATVRVQDRDTELKKAYAAVEYHKLELAHATDMIQRTQAKREAWRKRLDEFLAGMDIEVEEAKVEEYEARERLARAENAVADLTGQES